MFPKRLRLSVFRTAGHSVIAACFALNALPAHASDPREITSAAQVFSDRISLNLIIRDSTAARLCLDGIAASLHAKEFATEHSRIQRCAAELYQIKRGGKRLVPRAVQMHLSDEKDFFNATITYPAGSGDSLKLEASHLSRLQNTSYRTTLSVTRSGALLGQKTLRADDPSLEISLAVYDGGAGPSQRSLAARFRAALELVIDGHEQPLLAGSLGMMILLALLLWLRRKTASRP